MTLTIGPEIERLIGEQLKTGQFPDAESVVQAALLELSHATANVELDAEDIAVINRGEDDGDRGEVTEIHQYRVDFQKRLAGE